MGNATSASSAGFLALVDRAAIVVPQSVATRPGRERKDEIAEVEAYLYVDPSDEVRFEATGRRPAVAQRRAARPRRGWSRWIEASGVEALHVSYEDLCHDYAGTVARVARHVADVRLDPAAIPPIRLRRQRDERTEALLGLWR